MFSCTTCPAEYNYAPPISGGGFVCGNCRITMDEPGLVGLYGSIPHHHMSASVLCQTPACKAKPRPLELSELANNFYHCDEIGGCGHIYNFPVQALIKWCGSGYCGNYVMVPDRPDMTGSKFWCNQHLPSLPTIPSVGCAHFVNFTAIEYRYGIAEELKCLECNTWFWAKFSDYYPMLNPAEPCYTPLPPPRSLLLPVSTPCAPPIILPYTIPPMAPPAGPQPTIGFQFTFEELDVTGFLNYRPQNCINCDRKLSSTLDAYYGKDDTEAKKCSPCRLGRKV